MLIQLSKYKRVFASFVVFAFCMYNTALAVYATEINQTNVPFKTNTTIEQNNNIFNISTTTTNASGDTGINTFGKFNVSNGDIVNLNLINSQSKLVNLIFDSSASQINGIVNSYVNGQIGGNVLFANPNGFVVGQSGVFNVGSLTLITPTNDFMKSIFSGGVTNPEIVNDNLNSLITFNMNGSDYLLLGGGSNAIVQLNPAEITIDGKINSGAGINIINGGNEINLNNGSELNANMDFTVSGNTVTANPKANVTPTEVIKTTTTDTDGNTKTELSYKLAMDGGNGIVIASQNQKKNGDYLSSIVNLDGKVRGNGSDVLVQTEIYNSGIKSAKEYNKDTKHDVALSAITAKSNADIKGRDVALNAKTIVTSVNHDLLSSGNSWLDWLGPAELDFLISDFFNMADMKTSVEVQNGAKITADGSFNANAFTSFIAATSSKMENLAFNYTDVDIVTEAIIRSGANVKADNVNVLATTDMELTGATQSTNIVEIAADAFDKSFGHGGAYSITVTLLDVENRAVIEKAVNLEVAKNILVDAEMYRTYTNTTKNGMIPIIDKNFGTAGIGASVSIGNTVNEAVMESNADISGTLDVEANYVGATTQTILATAESKGESSQAGAMGKIFAFFKDLAAYKSTGDVNSRSYTRADGTFDKLKIAGAVGVAIDNVDNNARIGNTSAENTVKPEISAGNVVVKSSLLDNKSLLYTSATTSNGVNSNSGAVAVNIKNLDSKAEAYGDFTVKGNANADKEGFVISSDTVVTHGLSYGDWLPDLFDWIDGLFDTVSSKISNPEVESITTSNARDYISATTKASDIQKKIDDAGNLNILNAIDFSVLGLAQLFNTFAASSASAASKDQATQANSGAVSVAVHNTVSNAILHDNSNIIFKGADSKNNSLLVSAYTNDQIWSGAAMMGILNNLTSGGGGASARDGDSAGGAITFQWGSPDTIAKVGENVKITQNDMAKAGDITVKALDETDSINMAVANGAADESGLAGAISISAIDAGKVQASIESSNTPNAINGKDVKVTAKKDLTHINANVGASLAEDAKGIGIAINYADDEAVSYIAGNVNAANDVVVSADYDKLFVNGAINAGYAKTGTSTPRYGNISDEERQANMDKANEFLDKAEELKNSNKFLSYFRSLWNARNASETLANADYDFTRAINTDKNTAAKSGLIAVTISDAVSRAYIADGANVYAGNDLTVHAGSEDMLINGALALAIHGKSGFGGAFIGQWTENEVEAYIGNAIVDAEKNLTVEAKEDLKLFQGAIGAAQGSDKATAGNINVDIQNNTITAAIKDGAKVNTNIDNANQSINVLADLDTRIIKGLGTVSLQTGTGGNSGGATGATLDGDIAINEINAYIKDSEVNAGKELNVKAKSDINLISVDASGAVSAKDSSFAGTLGAFVALNEENAYIENSQINKTVGRVNKGADTTVLASGSFDNLAIVGTVAYGQKSSADGSVRVDGIGDEINSYIKDSEIDTTGSVTLKNNSAYDSLAVTAAGLISAQGNAISGAVALVIDNANQNNYIENSTINADSLNLDSDALFKTLGVTGALAISGGSNMAVGGSIYVGVIDNDINTYIFNSDVTANNDIELTSDYTTDILSIAFGGSGGYGLAIAGAISTFVNNSDSNTYIKSEAGNKNNIKSTNGKLTVAGTNDIDIKTINGGVAVSLGSDAIGASINTVVDNNDLYAAVEGVNVTTKGDTEVKAVSDEDIMAIAVGGAGGSGITAAGSLNTVVMASDIEAYIKGSDVTSETGNVKVMASGDSEITGGTGTLSISMSSMALGASIVTGVINNEIIAGIENSGVTAGNDVQVSATANETVGSSDAPFITVAGGFSQGLTVEGVVDTLVMNSTADSHIRGMKGTKGIVAGNDVSITSTGEDNIFGIGGAVGASTSAGVGATINTIVIDKDTLATAENTKIEAKNINAKAEETDNFFTTVVAAGAAGSLGVGGVVNTNVVTSDVKAGFKDSTLVAANDIKSDAKATADMQTITGAVGAAGSVGIGLSVVNDVIRYRLASYAENVDAAFDKLNINAESNNTYSFSTVSGGLAGAGGVAGVENVNYINNEVKAYATGKLAGNKADISAKDTVTFTDSYSGMVAAGGGAGIGATIEVNSVTSTILAYIGGNDINVDDINVTANGEQKFDDIYAIGFAGGGTAALAGTALANLVETTVKAYVADNSNISDGENATNSVKLSAENKTTITEGVGTVAVAGGGAFGASVGVNTIENTVEAYTGNNVNINTKTAEINAKSTNNIGTSDNELSIISGSAGLAAGIAGSVLYTSVEDSVAAYVGNNNNIKLADSGKLDVNATDTTKIYEIVGSGGVGLTAGIGATVGYNVIENTVLSFIGTGSVIDSANANVSLIADSNETVGALGVVIGGGAIGLSGGVIYSSVGKQVANASYNTFSEDDQKIFKSAKSQANKIISEGLTKNSAADTSYQTAYNEVLVRAKKNSAEDSRIQSLENVTESLFTKSASSGSSIVGTDRKGTTSAFVDTASNVTAKNLKINAKNTGNTDLDTDGVAIGLGAVGISAAVSDNTTTTNAFVSNNVVIDANYMEMSALSEDNQDINTVAAAGGIISGSGSLAQAKSNKTTNAYVLQDSSLSAYNVIDIKADSKSNVITEANAASFGAVAVGLSSAVSESTGSTRVDIGDNVSILAPHGAASICTVTDEIAKATAWAATGGIGSGGGGDAYAKTGKDSTINIGKNFTADLGAKFEISSNSKNYAFSDAEGRAYGGISAGGTSVESVIDQKSGVKISDADTTKTIKADAFEVSSKADNKTENTTYAGAGALFGRSGSTVKNTITSTNNVYVGQNYDITTAGKYSVVADTINNYKGYNKANAFGAVVETIPETINAINSTVTADSEADITAGGSIVIQAANEIAKDAVSGYDLYGGAGGLASGSGGSINDTLTMVTAAKLGGNKAYANGNFGNGSIDVSAYNKVNVNEKADLYAHGGIAGADTDSIVKLTADATTTVSNKDIRTKDDNINYTARNDVDIYTKSNVESYGGVAGAGGRSEATSSKQTASVVFESCARSISGRDTNISALSNKSLEAYIYAETGGLLSIVGGRADAHNYDSKALVTINSGAEVKSYDVMNIKALSTAQKIKAKRDALAYELGFIPYHGSGEEYTTNNNTSLITINGTVESGLGANRTLVINNDGTYTSEGINVKGKEEVGQITSDDIDSDIELYQQGLNNLWAEYDIAAAELKEQNERANAAITNATNEKNEIQLENKTCENNIEIWNAIGDINSENFAETYANSEVTEIQDLITALNSGDEASITEAKNALIGKQPTDSITDLENIIAQNNEMIINLDSIIQANNDKITELNVELVDIVLAVWTEHDELTGKIAALATKKEEMGQNAIPVYSMVIDNVAVRSGETNLTGMVIGTGSITAPGNKFTIDVVNNSVNDVVYNDLTIGRNNKGGIYGSNIDSGITQNIKNNENLSRISILNTVDANDPTISIDNGYGDIVLKGNVENVNGSVDITNYTGSILSEGSMTAKDLHIRVPNGAYKQQYITTESKIGGDSGTGAIVASGDIDIAAKIINVNGLIQSGSEIKEVTIPDFTVVKENDKYYQVVSGVKTEMKPSELTEGYYYLNLTEDTSDLGTLQHIKAYFKPSDTTATSDVPGDIYLFKASIEGGNITLTGNIVNDNNTGKIVLLNGYGHIDIVNNSNYNLVTSAINADTKGQGVLTINDFKVTTHQEDITTFGIKIGEKTVVDYDVYENIKQEDLTDEFLAAHSGKYTAGIDENGNVQTSSEGITAGNGSWGDSSSGTRADGAKIQTVTYNPGSDAYSVVSEGGVKSYQVYVKRSWWVEFFDGKKYETRYYYDAPQYAVKNNPVTVSFQGFDKPVINVISNGTGNVIMNNNISALAGDINITSGGNILTNNIKYVISGNNINLNAADCIGEEIAGGLAVKPIQVAVLDDGKLNAVSGGDIFINFPHTDISSVNLNANNGQGNVYVAAAMGDFDGTGKTIDIAANYLDLRADSINLDAAENENINISANRLKARAKDDISITNKGTVTLSSIVSENKGQVSIVSKEGSVLAAETTDALTRYNINGGNIVLKAINGAVGSEGTPIKIANSGIYYVEAKDDIHLKSGSKMYVDKIQSNSGSLFINSEYGIIASAITDEGRNYNLYSNGDINLLSVAENIENLVVDTNGTINALAGYSENNAVSSVSDLSDINIKMVAEKDMKIGTVKASQNVTLTNNGAVKNASDTSSVSGASVAIKAFGDIGEENSAINLTANKEITILSKGGANVYLTNSSTDNGMKINKIDTNNGEGSLGNVVINTAGNITNNSDVKSESEITNIRAENISLITAADKNIGAADRYLVVDTTSESADKGLFYQTKKAFINGAGALLNIIGGTTSDNTVITSDNNITAKNLTADNDAHSSNITLITSGNVNLSDATANTVIVNSANAEISGNIFAETLGVTTTGDTEITDAFVAYLTDTEHTSPVLDVLSKGNTNISSSTVVGIANVVTTGEGAAINADDTIITDNASFVSSGNTNISDLTVAGNFSNTSDNTTVTDILAVVGDAEITSTKDVVINEIASQTLSINSKNANIANAETDGNATIITSNNTTIANANVGGDFVNTSKNTTVTGKLTTAGDSDITSVNNIIIADAGISGDLNTSAKNVTVTEMKLDGNMNSKVDTLNLNTSNDLNIGEIKGNTNIYTNSAVITSAKNIKNGLTSDDKNINVKNLDITAGESMGTNDKSLNLELADGNNIDITASNDAYIDNTGAKAHYDNVISDKLVMNSDNAVTISNLNTDDLTLTTKSKNVNITGNVGIKGTIKTADKRIVIDNTSIAPDYNATAQLHITQSPIHLIVDSSNNIRTEDVNVTRHSIDTLINDSNDHTSMETEVTVSSESAIKNTNVGEKLTEKTDKSIYNMPTVSDYISSIVKEEVYKTLTDINGDALDKDNIMDVINTFRESKVPTNVNFKTKNKNKKSKIKKLNVIGYSK